MTDYNLGTPLGPDPRAVEDLEAIDTYVRETARPKIAVYPKSKLVIEDYEKWRQNISWFDLNVMINDTMRTAKAKRDLINKAQNNTIPSTWTVEPGSFVTSPDQSKPFKWSLTGPTLGFIIGGIAVTYLLLKYHR